MFEKIQSPGQEMDGLWERGSSDGWYAHSKVELYGKGSLIEMSNPRSPPPIALSEDGGPALWWLT